MALLEAFAKFKGYEFNGFRVEWLKAHPEVTEPIEVVAPDIKPTAKSEPEKLEISKNIIIDSGEGITISGENLKVEGNSIEEVVEEKPKRKHKLKAADKDASA